MSKPSTCSECTYYWPSSSDPNKGTCAAFHKKPVHASDKSCSEAED